MAQFYIRYQTATHYATHGPFADIDEARDAMLNNVRWYLGRLAVIVEAQDRDDALERNNVIEGAADYSNAVLIADDPLSEYAKEQAPIDQD